MTRRSLRNHHGKPHEHAPGDPLGVYLPPLAKWNHSVRDKNYNWVHPRLGWIFNVYEDYARRGAVHGKVHNGDFYGEGAYIAEFDGASAGDVYAQMKQWYASQTPASVSRRSERNGSAERVFAIMDRDAYVGVVDTGHRYYDVSAEGALAQYVAEERARGTSPRFYKDRYAVLDRRSERNPDWSALRAKASHYGSRAATGAREAYEWTAPRAKRAAAATWEGAKTAGRAVKRGAKRAAPVVARGARSAAESMERWAQTNGRCAMRNGATQGRMILVGNKRLGGHILRYSGHYGDAASRTGLAFYNREAIPLKDARDALQDLKWMAGFDTIHGRAWQRGEKSVLATTIKGLEAAIARAK